MNNILTVGNTEVNLTGFENIRDVAYFILRESGIFITLDATEITAPIIKCQVTDGKIFDENLIRELKNRGFDSNLFGKINNEYYCENPS
jgi:hypothetical protein